jgi:hypothetical protein
MSYLQLMTYCVTPVYVYIYVYIYTYTGVTQYIYVYIHNIFYIKTHATQLLELIPATDILCYTCGVEKNRV